MEVKANEIVAVRKKLSENSLVADQALQHHKWVAEWINSLAKESDSILEIGCGNCKLRNYLKAQYAGIDPIKHSDLSDEEYFRVGRGEAVPYPAASFDFMLIKDAINYFADIDPVLREASRVLNSNGSLLLTESVGKKFHPAMQVIKNLLKKYVGVGRNIWDSTYLNWYDVYFLIRSAKRFGFCSEFKYVKEESRYYLILKKISKRQSEV
ncbi:class I SAM-dependent methyltransferase [Chromobacterium violaceum]|uniref:class I SAM-dependent methyltransferase n=1 Tax=Chromobacterium violaceum TaxID=536 RepID=UPI0009DA351B|nr:class I SAM-dependent methyltransferase [Chromobacterium violaceum]